MSAEEQHPPAPSAHLQALEREEGRLWRVSLLFLGLIVVALGAALWESFRSLGARLQSIPALGVVAAVGFVVYAARKRRQIAELRGELRGLQEMASAPPTEAQLEQLARTIEKSQRGYRELVDSFDDLVLGLSLDGTIQSANRAACDLAGKAFADFVYHRLDEFLEHPTMEDVQPALAAFMRRRQWSGGLQVRFRGEARPRWFDCSFRAILNQNEVAGVSLWAREVTDTRERESRFTGLFETLHEAVYFTTPDGQLLDANQALVRLLGFDNKAELMSVSVPDLYVDSAERARFLTDLDRKGTVRDCEVRLRRRDGAHLACLDSARAVYDESGNVVRYQGTLVDITQRRRMEERLRQQEEFTRRVIECFPDAIVALDREYRCTFASPRIRELLGAEPEALAGKRFLPDMVEAHRVFAAVLEQKQSLASAEFPLQQLRAGWRTLRCTASPLFDAAGELAGVVASLRDVTEARGLQQQLIQRERMAAMGQMIEGFAHELNNPLTAILGAAELATAAARDSDSMRHLRLLKEQARRAAETVQNLLLFSHPPRFGTSTLNLNEVLHRTLMLHHYSLRSHNITIDFQPNNTLPLFDTDGNKLMQVFLTLIVHAEQAIRSCRERGMVHVRLGREKDAVWIKLQTDAGTHLAPSVAKAVRRVHPSLAQPDDMALSVARGIVESLDGNLQTESLTEGEVLFTVTLPERRATVSAAAAPA